LLLASAGQTIIVAAIDGKVHGIVRDRKGVLMKDSRMKLKPLLYVICVLTDFASFVVIFAVSRGLAESHVETWYLGMVGAGISFAAGIASALGGLLAHRFDGRVVFLAGASLIVQGVAVCALTEPRSYLFLANYWLVGVGLGFLYPVLIGWLNQGDDPHTNHSGVSRTLIVFCIAWNIGMMSGQLTAGSLFSRGPHWIYGTALAAALVNFLLAVIAVRRVVPLSLSLSSSTPPEPTALELAAGFKRLSWIGNLGGVFGGSMVIHLLPDLAVSIGVQPENHGVLLACWRVVIIATYLLMHLSAFWHYRLSASLGSQFLAVVGLVVIARAESAETLLIGLALLGQLVGYNYFSSLYYSTAGSSHESRALAAGIHEATLAFGMAIGTIAGGLLGSWVNHRMPYMMAAGVVVVLMALQSAAWWSWIRPLIRSAPRAVALPRSAAAQPTHPAEHEKSESPG
jgi:MFS family permease